MRGRVAAEGRVRMAAGGRVRVAAVAVALVAAVAVVLVAAVGLATAGPPGGTVGPPAASAVGPSAQEEPRRCPEPVPVEAVSGPFAWRADPGLERVARALAAERDLLAALPGIGDPAAALVEGSTPEDGARGGPGRTPGPAATVWVLADLGCLEAHGLTGAQPDWVAGVASARGRFIALRASRETGDLRGLPAVFRHELAHLALAAATGGHAPRWLHEGYAQYATGSWSWQEAWRLRFALLVRGGGVLEELSLGFPRDPQGARLAYLLSYTAVHELASIAGTEGMAAYFEALREGADVDGALRRVYGLTLDRFEERWRDRVEGRYGWLYVVSRASVFWVAVTLLLLWMGWRRRRRDRLRMEALRRAEREEAGRGEERAPWRDAGWTPDRPPGGLP